jgi:antitoxin (DNA-binding transcriptional repressor) of toxin-antitoxin stability system
MAKVEIEELKAQLGEYVGRARGGETMIVMDQGEPIAELSPLSPTRRKLLELAEKGEVSWEGGKPKRLQGVVVRGEPVSDTVIRSRR